MSKLAWEQLKRRFEIVGDKLRVVSPKEIAVFEDATGFRVPISYQFYCQVFGAGTLTEPANYEIAVPGLRQAYANSELTSLNQQIRRLSNEYRYYCNRPDLFERAWFFGQDIGTSYFFWDPLEVTDYNNREYGIFVIQRDYSIFRLTDSFWQFVNDICLGSGVPGSANTEPIRWVFKPAPITEGQADNRARHKRRKYQSVGQEETHVPAQTTPTKMETSGIGEWNGLFKQFDVTGDVRTATTSDLDDYETDTRFVLPSGYRIFCRVIGAGRLAKPISYDIAVPGPQASGDRDELRALNAKVNRNWQKLKNSCLDLGRFESARFFGTDTKGSHYFWDPRDICDSHGSEYGIYILYPDGKVQRLASSFWAFINDVCLGTGIPGYENPDLIEWVFEPAIKN